MKYDLHSPRLGSDYALDFIKYCQSKRGRCPHLPFIRHLEKRCKLCHLRGKDLPVPSFGSKQSKIMIIDSNPGKLQVLAGQDYRFEGACYNLLLKLLQSVDLNIQDCFITYSIHCNSSERDSIAYDKCSLWLNYELCILEDCDTIITLGEDAFHTVMGEGYPRVIDIYGSTYDIKIGIKTYKIIPLMHPWFLLKNPEFIEKTENIVKSTLGV